MSIIERRTLVICVSIRSLLIDVRLTIPLIQESAAANLADFIHCVPAILNTSPIRFGFLNVPRSKFLHDDFLPFPVALNVSPSDIGERRRLARAPRSGKRPGMPRCERRPRPS
jgi:hypothetical protein